MVRARHRSVVGAAVGVALALVCAPGVVRAEPTAAEVAVARKSFAEATELEKAEKWVEAEAKLREALAIKETPGLRYHLGYCLEKQGKLVDALVELDRADEMLRLGAKAPDVEKLLASARERVKKSVGEVTVRLSANIKGAAVEIDGVAVKPALIGKGIPLNPGRHVLTAKKAGRIPYRRELQVDPGGSVDVLISMGEQSGGAATPAAGGAASGAGTTNAAPAGSDDGGGSTGSSSASASLSDAAKPSSAKTWVLIGEGVVTLGALGAGIYFNGQAGDTKGEIDDASKELEDRGYDDTVCAKPPDDAKSACSQLADLTDQRDRQKNYALAGFIGAGVGAVATVATFFLWQPSSKSSGARSVRVAPVATQSTFGLGVVGRF